MSATLGDSKIYLPPGNATIYNDTSFVARNPSKCLHDGMIVGNALGNYVFRGKQRKGCNVTFLHVAQALEFASYYRGINSPCRDPLVIDFSNQTSGVAQQTYVVDAKAASDTHMCSRLKRSDLR